MKQDKTCKFLRKSSFSSYLQQYNRKQLNQLILSQLMLGGWREEKGMRLPEMKKKRANVLISLADCLE